MDNNADRCDGGGYDDRRCWMIRGSVDSDKDHVGRGSDGGTATAAVVEEAEVEAICQT